MIADLYKEHVSKHVFEGGLQAMQACQTRYDLIVWKHNVIRELNAVELLSS